MVPPPESREWPPLEPDPVIEAYKKGLDRTLLRENLRRTVAERLANLIALQEARRGSPKSRFSVTDFARLISTLTAGGVEFIIVGGLAATVHGSARLTQDVDIVYGRSDANLARLATSLAPFGPYLRGAPPGLPFDWSAATLRRGLNFTLTTQLGDIDVLGEIVGGGGYDELTPHTMSIDLFGHSCLCLDLPTLVRTKRAAGRPKDLEAVAELEALLEERRSS